MSCTRQQKPVVVHASVWKSVKWFRVGNVTHRVKYIRDAKDILDKHGRTLIVKFP